MVYYWLPYKMSPHKSVIKGSRRLEAKNENDRVAAPESVVHSLKLSKYLQLPHFSSYKTMFYFPFQKSQKSRSVFKEKKNILSPECG